MRQAVGSGPTLYTSGDFNCGNICEDETDRNYSATMMVPHVLSITIRVESGQCSKMVPGINLYSSFFQP